MKPSHDSRQRWDASREAGDRLAESRLLWTIGMVNLDRGQPTEARAWMVEGLEVCREVGNRFDEAYTLGVLGLADERLGDLDGAKHHLEAAIALTRETDVLHIEQLWQGKLALLRARQGDDDAKRRLAEAIGRLKGEGHVSLAADLLLDRAEFAHVRGHADDVRLDLREFAALRQQGIVDKRYTVRAAALERSLATDGAGGPGLAG